MPKLCEVCHKRLTAVLITTAEADVERRQGFCRECYDDYCARTPGMNASRQLICLSDGYRSKLYDLLEAAHPEVFDNSNATASWLGSRVMREFLREHLTKDGIELSEDGFEMLWMDFSYTRHFDERADAYRRKKS